MGQDLFDEEPEGRLGREPLQDRDWRFHTITPDLTVSKTAEAARAVHALRPNHKITMYETSSRRQTSNSRAASNNYATHRKLLPNCPLEGYTRHRKLCSIEHFKTGTAYEFFSLLELSHKEE